MGARMLGGVVTVKVRGGRCFSALETGRAIGAALALIVLLCLACASSVRASGVTNGGDDLRDGWYPEQPSLTPQLVSGGTFGKLWSTPVDGQVYAQPLLANGTLLVATENNKVYGLNPATGAMRWAKPLELGVPWRPADIECGDLTPNIGVTATPVIDATTNIAYITHKTYASGTSGPARWYMDAVEMASGTERPGFPVELSGSAQNQPGATFNPTNQLQRPGLLMMNGVVYAAFGSHCDHSPWQGWVFGVSTAGAVKARWVDVPAGHTGAGIWQSGSGLTSDGSGTILLSTGNGGAPTTPIPGNTPPSSLGESIVRLAVQADGSLKPVDFFAPFDASTLDSWDADFASGGLTALNEQFFGTPSIPHLAVAVGKSGYVYLLNRDNLGGIKQGLNGGDNVVQRIGPYGGVWSRPGVWPGDGGWIYIPTASGGTSGSATTGFLRVYQYGVSGSGQPTLSLQATSSDAFGFTSSAPVITSDGTNSGSALVWILWTPNKYGEGAQLRAYDPIPVEGHPILRWSAPVGTSSKFAVPGVGAGRIYVGTRDGHVLGFGSPVTPLLTGPSTSFPKTTIPNSSQKTLTLTATNTLTLKTLTSNSTQFIVGSPTPALPAHLSAGQTIQVPLTFTPSQSGLLGGTLTAETDQGSVSFAMSGTGQAATAQLTVTPAIVAFGATSVGGHLSGAATFRNVGGAPLTINTVKLPAAPFGASGVPAEGSKIEPGASVTVNVTFDPTANGEYSGQIALETTGGNGAVGLSGTAAPPGVLKVTNEVNEFGTVEVGKSASKSFTVTNTGGTAVTITKSKPPVGGAFEATTSLSEGSTIAPGATVTETVVFSPTAAGPVSAVWAINGEDTSGLHEVSFSGSGALPPRPVNTGAPSVTGSAVQGQQLTGHNGSWSNEPTSFGYQWQRCDASGGKCAELSTAKEQNYTPGPLDVGSTLRLAVTASNAGGPSEPAISPQTPVITQAAQTFGKTTVGGSITGLATNRKRVNRYTLATAGSVTKLSIYLLPSGKAGQQLLKGIIYADGSGAPTTLLGVSEQLTFKSTNAPGWYDLTFPAPVKLAAGNYWIGIITGDTQDITNFRYDSVTGARSFNNNTYTSGPSNPFGATTTDNIQASLYATYSSVSVSPPVDETVPTITGTPQQGQTLTEHNGTWSHEPTGYAYQWLQCDALGTGCMPILGAKAQTYAPTGADAGHTIAVQETASNAGGPGAAAVSASTAAVTASAPVNTGAPSVAGSAVQGQQLTGHNGSWSNEPTSFGYQWQRCDASGGKCAELSTAKEQNYTPGPLDVGSTLRLAVTASNAGGPSEPAISPQTPVITQAAQTFGKTTVGGSITGLATNRKRVNRYTLATAGSVTKLSIYLLPSGKAGQQLLKGIIYADGSGAPTTLLGVSEQLTFKSTNAPGWYDLTFPAPVKLAAGNYWIGIITGDTQDITNFRYDSVTGARSFNNNTYTSGPSNPFGATTTDNIQASLYATYS
jgi:hypothetical protein